MVERAMGIGNAPEMGMPLMMGINNENMGHNRVTVE